MNKAKKNIVVVGFTREEKNSLALPSIENNVVHYIDSPRETVKYQGYLLLFDNKDNKSITELDKRYRKTFNKYELIWFYNESYEGFSYKNKWSRIEKVGREIFEDYGYSFGEDWDKYKYDKEHSQEKTIRFNKDKEEHLNKLLDYLKKYKNIKTSQISNDLNIDKRSIQRYMHDLNNIYHNIGYDYSTNEWYFMW